MLFALCVSVHSVHLCLGYVICKCAYLFSRYGVLCVCAVTCLSLFATQSFALFNAHPACHYLTLSILFHDMSVVLRLHNTTGAVYAAWLTSWWLATVMWPATVMRFSVCQAAFPLTCFFASVFLCATLTVMQLCSCPSFAYSLLLFFSATLLHLVNSTLPLWKKVSVKLEPRRIPKCAIICSRCPIVFLRSFIFALFLSFNQLHQSLSEIQF